MATEQTPPSKWAAPWADPSKWIRPFKSERRKARLMKIQDRFEEFDRANPEVYSAIVKFARQAKGNGFSSYGMKSVWERMRWHFQFEKQMGDDFKLNNNYCSRYARKVMQHEADLSDFFETRRLRAA
jgi:hypothetical protein